LNSVTKLRTFFELGKKKRKKKISVLTNSALRCNEEDERVKDITVLKANNKPVAHKVTTFGKKNGCR